jgi:hypothetical protein
VSPSFYHRWTKINTDALWSSTEDNKGNKGMKHRQISSSIAAQEAVENLLFLLFHRAGQSILARATLPAVPATRAVSENTQQKKVSNV